MFPDGDVLDVDISSLPLDQHSLTPCAQASMDELLATFQNLDIPDSSEGELLQDGLQGAGDLRMAINGILRGSTVRQAVQILWEQLHI